MSQPVGPSRPRVSPSRTHGSARRPPLKGAADSVRPGRVDEGVAAGPTQGDCRDRHRWRVIGFDYPSGRILERCSQCDMSQERVAAYAKQAAKPKRRRRRRA